MCVIIVKYLSLAVISVSFFKSPLRGFPWKPLNVTGASSIIIPFFISGLYKDQRLFCPERPRVTLFTKPVVINSHRKNFTLKVLTYRFCDTIVIDKEDDDGANSSTEASQHAWNNGMVWHVPSVSDSRIQAFPSWTRWFFVSLHLVCGLWRDHVASSFSYILRDRGVCLLSTRRWQRSLGSFEITLCI